MVFLEAGKLAYILRHHVRNNDTGYILYTKIFLEVKISLMSVNGSCPVFPEFHCVALFVVYSFHPIAIFQSGVSVKRGGKETSKVISEAPAVSGEP